MQVQRGKIVGVVELTAGGDINTTVDFGTPGNVLHVVGLVNGAVSTVTFIRAYGPTDTPAAISDPAGFTGGVLTDVDFALGGTRDGCAATKYYECDVQKFTVRQWGNGTAGRLLLILFKE